MTIVDWEDKYKRLRDRLERVTITQIISQHEINMYTADLKQEVMAVMKKRLLQEIEKFISIEETPLVDHPINGVKFTISLGVVRPPDNNCRGIEQG